MRSKAGQGLERKFKSRSFPLERGNFLIVLHHALPGKLNNLLAFQWTLLTGET